MTDIELVQLELDELKRSNRALQQHHERFLTIFERSRLGNKIIDKDLRILEVNMALVKLLGYDLKDEIIGTRIFDYAPADRRDDWKFLQEKLWSKLTPSFSLETCLLKKDGTLIWCQVTSILIPDNGETLGYTIIEDITEQHYLRLQREEFISVASHELKTPITNLKLTTQLMNRVVGKHPDTLPELAKMCVNAERHVNKLGFLVEDLLNTTKLEQGQLTLNKTIFSIADVIDGCCSHVNLSGGYSIVYQGDHELKVLGDQQKIDQVMVNLINNAIKYAPESKAIVIQVEQTKEGAKVSVRDKGPGIDQDSLTNLFERFFRGKRDKDQSSGLGLGLYISSEIIKRHGGEMGVASTLGEGSNFWFTLPNA